MRAALLASAPSKSTLFRYTRTSEKMGMAPRDAAITKELSKHHLAFDSQISQPSHLLSLPSEPPDVRNWFSSYEYESPATLDVEGDFRGLVASSKEEIHCKKEKDAESVENHQDSSNGESNESRKDFDDSFLEESKQEFYQEEEIMGSPNLLSLPSEPPDIRNWFSSYEYESPATLDCINLLITSEEGIEDAEEKTFGRIENSKVGNDDENNDAPYDDGPALLENLEQGCHLESKNQLPQKGHYIPPLYKVNSSVEDEEQVNDKGSTKNSPASLEVDESSYKCQDKSTGKPIPRVHVKTELQQKNFSDLTPPETNSSKEGLNESSPVSSSKEEHKELRNNGFISTRNRETTKSNTRSSRELGLRKDENSSAGKHSKVISEVSPPENAGVLFCKKAVKSVSDGRMTLSDRTNFYTESNSEISGKWHCSRKTKPYIGPPLKQLRLERWVHRVL